MNAFGDGIVAKLIKDAEHFWSRFQPAAMPEFLNADVVFTCAACGERVGRYRKAHTPRRWQVPNDFTCTRHGRLRDDTLDGLEEKWTARGKPERMTVQLRPERRGGSR